MQIGMEKESLIFDDEFKPVNYELSKLPDNVTLDFSNNHIEFVSSIHNNVYDLVKEMNNLLNEDIILKRNMWPLSVPGLFDYEVKYDSFTGQKKLYRDYLADKYGCDLMNLSGIHLNVNINGEQDEEYNFNLMKKIYTFIPVILQFVAYTPFYSKEFKGFGLENIGKNLGLENSMSLRNSIKFGYMNYADLSLDYSNVNNYHSSVDQAVKDGKIASKAELYVPIRLKNIDDRFYLELRFLDINPYFRLGIDIDMLLFLKVILKYISQMEDVHEDVYNAVSNFEKVSIEGKNKLMTLEINGEVDTLSNHTVKFLESVLESELPKDERYVVKMFLEKYKKDNLDFNKLYEELIKDDLSILDFGKKYSFQKEKYAEFFPDKKMELSTKILMNEALKNSIDYNIISEKFNLVELNMPKGKELVLQATKTNKDNYCNVDVMDNKYLTKLVLSNAGFSVPEGTIIKKDEWDALKDINLDSIKSDLCVIKPLDTNYGLGISILKSDDKEQIFLAIDKAFEFSNHVIVEEFFKGEEFRFLVIDGEVVSIIGREGANVVGDGEHTIQELVALKNDSELRGVGYVSPLELIKLGEEENKILARQNLSTDDVLDRGVKVYLRNNSNVSTGGDSFEVLDNHYSYMKEIAAKTAEALGVKICGVDIIINDDYTDYKILEANYNPAIQMHTYPYKGIGKNIASHILQLLSR